MNIPAANASQPQKYVADVCGANGRLAKNQGMAEQIRHGSLARLLNRLFQAIERTYIDRPRSASFRLLNRNACISAVGVPVRAWRNGLEPADGEGRKREFSF